MLQTNTNYLGVSENYLFSTIAQKIKAYAADHPDRDIIRLGIGDVTLPLAPAVISALQSAVDEQSHQETFHGYSPDLGYDFLRRTISEQDYMSRGCRIDPDEIFISDGAKCDIGNLQELFSENTDVAICDPVYPVYADSNLMAGRNINYMPCREEFGFLPDPAASGSDPCLIYLCFPNNPTGAAITKGELQLWVDHALKTGSVIIYDAAYEAYISDPSLPHSIYECKGAEACSIEVRSFSKNAGFTGLRLGFTVIPKELRINGTSLHDMWARRHSTKYNGAPYIIQRAGEAVYSPEGRKQTRSQIDYYMRNANLIMSTLKDAGYSVTGGLNAPYIWMKTPGTLSSWEFFDLLLEKAQVVGTPGSGFGACGEGYFRLTAFGEYEKTKEALSRIVNLI